MRIYLSSPFQYSRADCIWKDQVRSVLASVNPDIETVDPCPDNVLEEALADQLLEENNLLGYYSFCSNIVESDLAMLNKCDGVFVYLPPDAITFGTTHEIVHALNRNIPIVLVTPDKIKNISRWLWGLLGPNRIFSDINEATRVLAKRIVVSDGGNVNDEVYYPGWSKTNR